jgi:hypothetical protein
MTNGNIAASVRNRLLNHARTKRQDFNLVLTRYAIERRFTGSAFQSMPISFYPRALCCLIFGLISRTVRQEMLIF